MGRRKTRKVLQIDGGGIRGVIPVVVLAELERLAGKPLNKVFDLMSGTSTGSIICGMLAAGVPAKVIRDLYVNNGAALFTKIPWWKRFWGLTAPKYDRSAIQKILKGNIAKYASGDKMSDVKTDFVSATFNATSGRTHFQSSWWTRHEDLKLIDVISWSALSAVHYFGPIAVPNYIWKQEYQRDVPVNRKGAVFYDGGQGRNNCSLAECINTCIIRGWLPDSNVHILSIGTGATKLRTKYIDAADANKFSRVKSYLSQSDDEAVYDQYHRAVNLADHLDNFNIYRLDVILKKDEDKLDALDKVPQFLAHGRSLVPKLPAIFKK